MMPNNKMTKIIPHTNES